MKTVTIQIGNSDNKLSQSEWSLFVGDLASVVRVNCGEVFFCGHSAGDAPWQNHCVVTECNDLGWLTEQLRQLVEKYDQDSIAVTAGATVFVKRDRQDSKP